jgi:hypothetical protein
VVGKINKYFKERNNSGRQRRRAPRENLNPQEPSHKIVLENPFHKFSSRTRQVVIDSKGWTTMAEI